MNLGERGGKGSFKTNKAWIQVSKPVEEEEEGGGIEKAKILWIWKK